MAPFEQYGWFLLCLDGHGSHKQLEVAKLCREHKVELLVFPPHCSHIVQPLDLSCFSVLKKGIQKAFCDALSASEVIVRSDVPLLIKPAWQTVFTPKNIKGAFRAAGISPLVGLSAVPKDKLSPCLAIEAAAGNSSALLSASSIEDLTALSLIVHKKRQHKPALTEVERLRIENRELKRALVALKVVERLHPEQVGIVKSSKRKGPIDQGKKGVVRTTGAQHATADEWMAMMEEEDRIKEQKKREAEERAMVRKAKRAKKEQEKEAKKQCSAVFKSGKRKGQQCTVMCLPNTQGDVLCKRHNATSLAVMPLDVNQPNEHKDSSDTSEDDADSLCDDQCTNSSLEVD